VIGKQLHINRKKMEKNERGAGLPGQSSPHAAGSWPHFIAILHYLQLGDDGRAARFKSQVSSHLSLLAAISRAQKGGGVGGVRRSSINRLGNCLIAT